MTVPSIALRDGTTIPKLGFGVFKIPDAETEAAVTAALEAGYRSIDTAALYRNERAVGRAIAASRIPRDELYVTTKVWNDDQGYDSTLRAFDESRRKLDLDALDLYLIHWPAPARDLYVDTWRALIHLQEQGGVRSIGVSNFQPAHLQRLAAEADVVPVVNQIELHPFLQQREVRAANAELGVATEAWSPLAKGSVDHPTLLRVAERHGRTPAQVVLRWHLDLGNVVIPKSVTPSRIRENIDVFDFSLTEEDRTEIASLDAGTRTGPDPDDFS